MGPGGTAPDDHGAIARNHRFRQAPRHRPAAARSPGRDPKRGAIARVAFGMVVDGQNRVMHDAVKVDCVEHLQGEHARGAWWRRSGCAGCGEYAPLASSRSMTSNWRSTERARRQAGQRLGGYRPSATASAGEGGFAWVAAAAARPMPRERGTFPAPLGQLHHGSSGRSGLSHNRKADAPLRPIERNGASTTARSAGKSRQQHRLQHAAMPFEQITNSGESSSPSKLGCGPSRLSLAGRMPSSMPVVSAPRSSEWPPKRSRR